MWYCASFVCTCGSQPSDRPSGGKLWQWVSTTRVETEPVRLHPVPKYSEVDSLPICVLPGDDAPELHHGPRHNARMTPRPPARTA